MDIDVIESEDDTVVTKETSDDKKNYVIAESVNTQKRIAENLHIIKWLMVIMIIGLFFAGIFGLIIYGRLDALNVLS